MGKRLQNINLPNTEDNRRKYRELLFTSGDTLSNNISGVILFDETFRQTTADGKPFVQVCISQWQWSGMARYLIYWIFL